MDSKKKLILFTDGYPYLNTPEAVFIPPELSELIKSYEVTIVACTDENGLSGQESLSPEGRSGAERECRKRISDPEISENIGRILCYVKPRGKYLSELACLIKAVFDPVFRSEAKRIRTEAKTGEKVGAAQAEAASKEPSSSKKLFWAFLHYYWAADFARWMEKQGIMTESDSKEPVICYTFWNNYYLLALCRAKDRYPGMKLISRIHGYDLFDDQSPVYDQPFKAFMDEKTDRTVFLSEQGREYFERRFRTEKNREKHPICRMGVGEQIAESAVSRPEVSEPADRPQNKCFLLVSCASIYPVKHIEGIIEGLALLEKEAAEDTNTAASKDRPIKWVHFGPGDDEYAESVKALAKEKLSGLQGITYEFRGYVPNEEVIRFYLKEQPSCFITTSFSEGSPVSVQEALSCALPVIGPDVGAIGEMIDQNGVLLSAKPGAEEVKDAIREIFGATAEDLFKMRKRSLEIRAEKFDREKNLREFLIFIGSLWTK